MFYLLAMQISFFLLIIKFCLLRIKEKWMQRYKLELKRTFTLVRPLAHPAQQSGLDNETQLLCGKTSMQFLNIRVYMDFIMKLYSGVHLTSKDRMKWLFAPLNLGCFVMHQYMTGTEFVSGSEVLPLLLGQRSVFLSAFLLCGIFPCVCVKFPSF